MKTLRIPVYLFVISMVVAAGRPSMVFAEFNLDKLKGWAEKAKGYQEKLKQDSPSNTSAQTDPSAQASSDTALTPETQGGSITQTGPNILGIRLGMAPSEVRRILEGRPGMRVIETPSALAYQPVAGHQKKIPNSDYVLSLIAIPIRGEHETIQVDFTPVAGRERAVSIELKQSFPVGQKPSVEATVRALIDKYGAVSNKSSPGGLYFWRFDSQAKLLDIKPGVVTNHADVCRNPARSVLRTSLGNAQPLHDLLVKFENCGHTQVFAQLDSGSSPVVHSLKVHLSAWVEAVAARRASDRFIENYGKSEAGKKIREADKRKLDL